MQYKTRKFRPSEVFNDSESRNSATVSAKRNNNTPNSESLMLPEYNLYSGDQQNQKFVTSLTRKLKIFITP